MVDILVILNSLCIAVYLIFTAYFLYTLTISK